MNLLTSPDPLLSRMAALGDPIRLRLLVLLEREELGVGELAEVLQLPQSSVSRHLKQLAEAGWIVSRSERTANLYRMPVDELDIAASQLWMLSRGEIADWAVLEHDALRLDQRLTQRRSVFADVADEWDDLRTELYGTRFTDVAIRSLLPRDLVVADLACGSGAASSALAPHVARVIGVDSQPAMIAAAQRREIANLELRVGDLASLPIADCECDAAICLLALSHVDDPGAALAEMARVVRPGGQVSIVDLLHHGRDDFRRRMGALRAGFTRDELARLVADAGFARVTCELIPPEPQAKGPALLIATAERIRP